MAICLFDYFPFGGMQKDALSIARALHARGAEVRLVVKQWEGERPADLKVDVLRCRGLTNGARNRDYLRQLPAWRVAQGIERAVGFQRMPGLDAYYAADSCFAAKARGARGPLYRLTSRARDMLANEEAVFGAASSTRLLMISAAEIAVYQHYYGTPQERFHLLPPGISRDRVRPADAVVQRAAFRAEHGIGEGEQLLLLVGSGFRTKGLDRAIHALAALPDTVRLFVVGHDDHRPFVRLARRLRVEHRLRFFGGRRDVPRFLLGADLLIHPAYRENTGTVLLEAGVAGLPVVATAVCGYAGYLTEYDFGRVVAEPFAQSVLDATVREMLASDPAAWQASGQRFAATADIYDMPARAAEIILQ